MFLRSLGAEILEIEIDLVGNLVVDRLRYIDAARPGQRPDPRCDVDAVAEDVASLDDDIAEIDADPHPMRRSSGNVWFICATASRRPAAQRAASDDVVELDEHQFSGLFEDISAEFDDQRLDDLGQKTPQVGEAVRFIARQQPAVAGHQDGRKSAPDAPSHIL